jgi:hypothetical protein
MQRSRFTAWRFFRLTICLEYVMGKREGPPSLADVEALLRQASLDLESIVAQERRGEIWPGASGPARQRYESLARRCRQVQVGLVARRGAAPEADYLAYGRMKRKYVTALTESQAAQRDLPKAEQLVADRHQSVDRAKVNLEVCLKTDDKLAVGRGELAPHGKTGPRRNSDAPPRGRRSCCGVPAATRRA